MPSETPRLLLVAYDLKSPETQGGYANLVEALQKKNIQWWHYLESTWLLYTKDSPNEIWELVKPHVNTDIDRMLIIEVSPPYQGWLAKDAWDWINTRFREIYASPKGTP